MSSFLQNAEEIFETASQNGAEDCHLAILVGREGAIHMLAGSDWELERLREHHGAKVAYRISRNSGQVHLEARGDGQSCVLRGENTRAVLRGALPEFPRYRLAT